MSRLPVLCCCTPDNELGTAPADTDLPTYAWQDTEGATGRAFKSEDADWSAVPGFEMAGKKRPRPKRPRPVRTWRD